MSGILELSILRLVQQRHKPVAQYSLGPCAPSGDHAMSFSLLRPAGRAVALTVTMFPPRPKEKSSVSISNLPQSETICSPGNPQLSWVTLTSNILPRSKLHSPSNFLSGSANCISRLSALKSSPAYYYRIRRLRRSLTSTPAAIRQLDCPSCCCSVQDIETS